ncbi:MAG: hypothetical protein OEZ14_04025 [Acidimicrobiia bacterium]|nr:hypothetical protein [Acidimicrobiia bacterium]
MLRILASTPLSTPTLAAAEYTPDVGRLLMTWLGGRIVIDRDGLGARVPALAAVAADIAATPLPRSPPAERAVVGMYRRGRPSAGRT